jgi:single-stranded-DNA-specific exonuclease
VSDEFRAFLLDATSLAALGTIADVVPLTQENRILAKFGMAGLRESKHVGLQALIESAKLADQKLNSEHVGFWLAPRLNAAGRMGHARLAVELLTYADETQAGEIAAFLDQQNRSRQNTEKQIFRQACAMIEEQNLASDARRAIVLASEGWHAGVIGIVASRIVDRFGRPTIMIALDNNKGQGSARSISPFQMHVALERCSHLLEGFGGHAMAAGISIQQDKIEEFTEQFVAHANNMLTARDLLPTLHLDAEAGLEELTEPTVQQLEQLGPFGIGNPKPRFASRPLQLVGEPRLVGNGNKHLQMNLSDGRIRRKAIAFNQADHLQPLLDHRTCRVAFEPMLNHFRGRTSVELKISDVVFES